MRRLSRVLGFGILLVTFCIAGLAQEEITNEKENFGVAGGFYFPDWDPQSKSDYVGVFPVSRRTGYYVYRAGQPEQMVGEISGSPFVFHSGPQYCGWIGLPGLGWFGCGLHPSLPMPATGGFPTSGTDDARATSIHLTPGMSRGEVMETVGSPARMIFLGTKEIWEYKSHSLLFESDALKEIR